MNRDRTAPTARAYFRRHAENVERAGDSVGSNDMELANDLYALAGRLRRYADTFDPEVAAEPVKLGEIVRVNFSNGIVTAVEGEKIRVGSARFYGGGYFDRDDVTPIR